MLCHAHAASFAHTVTLNLSLFVASQRVTTAASGRRTWPRSRRRTAPGAAAASGPAAPRARAAGRWGRRRAGPKARASRRGGESSTWASGVMHRALGCALEGFLLCARKSLGISPCLPLTMVAARVVVGVVLKGCRARRRDLDRLAAAGAAQVVHAARVTTAAA